MDKLFLDSHGEIIEWDGGDRRERVRFPVCLSVECKGCNNESCADFILNISKSGVFVMTDRPFEKGAQVTLRFYIPPEEKALSEFEGVVVGENTNPVYPRGMHIRITGSSPGDLKRLEDFLEGRRHLIDIEA